MKQVSPWEDCDKSNAANANSRKRFCEAKCQAAYMECEKEKAAAEKKRKEEEEKRRKEEEERKREETGKAVAGTAVAVGGAYVTYRILRFLPSLFPPAWPTIPANLAIP